MQEITWNYRVGKATVHCIIQDMGLWDVLLIVQSEPTEEDWINVAESYFRRRNIPNCIGVLDGKHVVIQSPKLSGASGSNHDSTVFIEIVFGKALLTNALSLPPATKLRGTEIVMNYFAVADAAFPLSGRIMRRYPGKDLPNKNNIFNYRLSRSRRAIENTFGILVQRWRILRGIPLLQVLKRARIL